MTKKAIVFELDLMFNSKGNDLNWKPKLDHAPASRISLPSVKNEYPSKWVDWT